VRLFVSAKFRAGLSWKVRVTATRVIYIKVRMLNFERKARSKPTAVFVRERLEGCVGMLSVISLCTGTPCPSVRWTERNEPGKTTVPYAALNVQRQIVDSTNADTHLHESSRHNKYIHLCTTPPPVIHQQWTYEGGRL